MKNANANDLEFAISPKILKKNAKSFCKALDSETTILLYQCEECLKPHIRFITRGGQKCLSICDPLNNAG
ncbi:MAG: hypothetical protein NVSMB6_16170 [Burkholderiaceae bacterium]